eukprot:1830612-Pyramimonas_sp.AAC.1
MTSSPACTSGGHAKGELRAGGGEHCGHETGGGGGERRPRAPAGRGCAGEDDAVLLVARMEYSQAALEAERARAKAEGTAPGDILHAKTCPCNLC